ncbi:MAG: MoaD/ThiS family protein [Armatimonadota bacterium]|nr:MoaD/ThiS family protein [Armatimonadota bacterium]MDR7405056.1 MoaD/ThiS family protein [Armatimonadota bacterium]
MATVRIPTPLRRLVSDQRVVEAHGATVADLVDDLERRFPGLKARLVDGDGHIHSFVTIFVNDQDVRLLQGLQTPLDDDAEVSIIPAMAGGEGTPRRSGIGDRT